MFRNSTEECTGLGWWEGEEGGREGRVGMHEQVSTRHVHKWVALITRKLVSTDAFQECSMTLSSVNYILGGKLC